MWQKFHPRGAKRSTPSTRFIARQTICRIFVSPRSGYTKSRPKRSALAANAARFALLLDHNAAAGRDLAKQAYEKAPNDPATAVTYAFALYGIGRTAEGIKILETLPPDQLNDPHAAVYAALLYDDENQLDAANKYIALARDGPIFPEEKQLLEEIATRRKNAADSLTPSPSPSPD